MLFSDDTLFLTCYFQLQYAISQHNTIYIRSTLFTKIAHKQTFSNYDFVIRFNTNIAISYVISAKSPII